MEGFFNPSTVAVIGVNREKGKVGNTIFKNMIDSFEGKTYAVNPKADKVYGHKCYGSVLEISASVDLAIIAVPAKIVPEVVKECADKHIKNVIIVAGGFSEIGRSDLEYRIKRIADMSKMKIIGPNCLGVYDTYSGVDTLFLPPSKMKRPKKGKISFISQSGAVGSVVLDWMNEIGFSKFISYGNALDINEVDLLEYLGSDRTTDVICIYLEGTKAGRKMMAAAKKVSKRKPIIVIKAGRTEQGSKAVASHTGSLAGADIVYSAAFKQSGMIRVNTIDEVFMYAKAFVKQPLPKGKRIQILTNGGGFGVMATDAIIEQGLELAEMESKTKDKIVSELPEFVIVSNPIDLVGDADSKRYKAALSALEKDKNIDAILCITLLQTTDMDALNVIKTVKSFSDKRKKPIVVCCAGSDYVKKFVQVYEDAGIPVYETPLDAAKALKVLNDYSKIKLKK